MTERESWQQLLDCPGWLLLGHRVREYWSGQIEAHLALATNDRDDIAALNKVRQILAARQAVEALLLMPQEQIRALDAQSGRQAIPDNLAEVFSRRGGL